MGSEWTVTVDSYNTDANDIVAEAMHGYNDPPTAGSHYEILTATTTYTGEGSSYTAMVRFALVTESGNVIDGSEALVLLDDDGGFGELYTGGSLTFSKGFLVPDGEAVTIRVSPGFVDPDSFVKP